MLRVHHGEGRDAIIAMMERQGRRAVFAALALAAAGFGCDFQPDPDPGPTAVAAPAVASVTIVSRQPNACENTTPGGCDNLVVFFGSWMHAGQEIYLTSDAGGHFWTGTATDVPVNWPPTDEPHFVRVFDPHLVDTSTGGVTGARLTFGGQVLTTFDSPGTPQESALAYVDYNGVGRNPP
jgi:hypothetical protein